MWEIKPYYSNPGLEDKRQESTLKDQGKKVAQSACFIFELSFNLMRV